MDHPELLMGPNPLFDALAPFLEFAKLPSALLRQPLKSIKWQSEPPSRREVFLDLLEKEHFFPTRTALDISSSIQLALRASLVARNPLSEREKIRINRLAIAREASELTLQALHTPAGGGTLGAVTGMGKSVLILRTLHVCTRTQVVTHGKSEVCGWSKCVQIVYLYIDAPSNGSRGGLLVRILEAVDALIGTSYSTDAKRQRNLEGVILLVIRVLSIHRVGMLVIDEQQNDNFEESPWQREFVLLFFALMNMGIPVFLCGNPLAFVKFKSSSQVVRRFSQIGFHSLVPASSDADSWWLDELVHGVMQFALCEEVRDREGIRKASRSASGGIPGIFSRLWRETQLVSLRRASDRAVVTLADFTTAQTGARTAELGKIATYISNSAMPESTYSDLPRDSAPIGDATAGSSTTQQPPSAGTVAAPGPSNAKILKSIRAAMKREEAKQKKRKDSTRSLAGKLSDDDLRNAEKSLLLLSGLDKAQQLQLALKKSADS
jgi:hypothetical protein